MAHFLPNLFAVCQTLLAIKGSHSACAKKPPAFVDEIDSWCQFYQRSMSSFQAHRSKKCKKILMTKLYFFTLLVSALGKAVRKTLMKSTPVLLAISQRLDCNLASLIFCVSTVAACKGTSHICLCHNNNKDSLLSFPDNIARKTTQIRNGLHKLSKRKKYINYWRI